MSIAACIARDLEHVLPQEAIEEMKMRLFALHSPVLHVPEAIRVFKSNSHFITQGVKFALLKELWKKAVEIENYRIWNGLITKDLARQCELHETLSWRNAWVMASFDKDEFRKEIQHQVEEGDVDGLLGLFAGMYTDLERQFNESIEIVRNKQTNDKAYRNWTKIEDVKMLRIDLLYVKTRVPPFCNFCETFLNQDKNWADYTGYNYLKNQVKTPKVVSKVGGKGILQELGLDYSQYNLVEWPCDWNDRYCRSSNHPDYKHILTKEGENYTFAKGLLINPFFPSMAVTLIQKGKHFRSQIFRALGEKVVVKDEKTGQKSERIKYNTRELILAFLEGKDDRIQSLIARSSTRDPYRASVNDPVLYK